MSTLAQNSCDNRSTTGVVVALLLSEKKYLKYYLIYNYFHYCSFSARLLSPTQICGTPRGHWRVTACVYSSARRGVGRRRPGASGSFCFGGFCAQVGSSESTAPKEELDHLKESPLEEICFSEKFHLQPKKKKVIIEKGAKINFVYLKHSLI